MYSSMSWQGSQAYNSSAKSAHEAKMGSVLAGFRGLPQGTFLPLVPVLLYVYMNHPFTHIASAVNLSLSELDTDTLKSQMRGPIFYLLFYQMGLLGAFAALMLAAFVSTHDTYLHSWATILVQDVVMPFRDKPFDKETHIKVLSMQYLALLFSYSFSVSISAESKNCSVFRNYCGYFCRWIGGCYHWWTLLETRDYYCCMDRYDRWCLL